MGRIITLSMAVLMTIGGTGVVLSDWTNNYGAGYLDLSGFVVDNSGAHGWTNNYGVGYLDISGLGNTHFGADWTNYASSSPDLRAFVINNSGVPDWTNNYGAGYPDLSGAATGWRVPSVDLRMAQSKQIAP